MARAIRFTKPERELLARLVRPEAMDLNNWGSKVVKTADGIRQKLAESEAPQEKSRSYLTVVDAIAAFRSVLDRRLVPPMGTAFMKMQAQLKSLGLNREQCVAAAEQAGREWRGSIKAQSILNQAERLLHNAESEPLPLECRRYETRDTMTDL